MDLRVNRFKSSLTNQRFGRLFIGPPVRPGGRWWAWCDCGEITTPMGQALKQGRTRSCGCLNDEVRRTFGVTHGASRVGKLTREYRIWQHMRGRCGNPTNDSYHNYGGRGIKVCERWDNSFELFLEDMGPCPPGRTIERKDVNGDYELENCRWISKGRQSWNRRDTIRITRDGETLPLKEWASRLGFSYGTVTKRYRRGCPVDQLFTPAGSFKCSKDWVRRPSLRSASQQ